MKRLLGVILSAALAFGTVIGVVPTQEVHAEEMQSFSYASMYIYSDGSTEKATFEVTASGTTQTSNPVNFSGRTLVAQFEYGVTEDDPDVSVLGQTVSIKNFTSNNTVSGLFFGSTCPSGYTFRFEGINKVASLQSFCSNPITTRWLVNGKLLLGK